MASTGLASVERRLLHKKALAKRLAPTGLAPVERGFVHKEGRFSPFSAPTGLAPVERRLLHQRSDFFVFKPPLHRGKPGGGVGPRKASLVQKPTLHRGKPGGGGEKRDPPSLCTNPRSSGASPAGALQRAQSEIAGFGRAGAQVPCSPERRGGRDIQYSSVLTSNGFNPGRSDNSRAAMPARCGAAQLVAGSDANGPT
jgi:hypothetical protein